MTRRSRNEGGILLRVWCGAVFAFLLAPFAIIFLTSFTAGETVAFPPPGYSLRWYAKATQHLANAPGLKPDLMTAFLFSLRVGLIVGAGTTVAGVMVAYALYRHRFPGRDLVRLYFLLPLIFPQLIVGVSLLIWFSQIKVIGTFARLIIGHMIVTLPYVILTVGASLEVTRTELEEAAMGLGASRTRAFLSVTLPLIAPGVTAGALLAFIISFNNFTVTYFLSSADAKPLTIWVFEYIAFFLDPTLAVICTLLIVLTLLGLFVLDRLIEIGRMAAR